LHLVAIAAGWYGELADLLGAVGLVGAAATAEAIAEIVASVLGLSGIAWYLRLCGPCAVARVLFAAALLSLVAVIILYIYGVSLPGIVPYIVALVVTLVAAEAFRRLCNDE
jgi:hypothetical protein